MYCWNYTKRLARSAALLKGLPQNYTEEKGKAFDFKLSNIIETKNQQ